MIIEHPPEPSKIGAPLRILLWSPWGAGEHYSGPGMSAFRLYSCDRHQRFAVTLAHGREGHADYELFTGQVMIRPISAGLVNQMLFVRAGRAWLAEHHGEFDVFHGLWAYEAVVAPAVFARRQGLPAVVRVAAHQQDLADKGGWKNWLGVAKRRRETICKLDAVIAISRAIHEELIAYGVPARKIALIRNGVDVHRFRPADDTGEKRRLREALHWPERPVILFVGGVEPRKRPHLLVASLAELNRRGHNCQLVLAGPEKDAAYVRSMRQAADESGVAEQVTWSGMVRDVELLCRASDLFALPSANEGMPNALLEAMSSGLPPVVTAISGTTDLVRDGESGRFVEPSIGSVTDALAAYLDDPESVKCHGTQARRFVVEHHSAEATLDAHERLFRAILAGRDANE